MPIRPEAACKMAQGFVDSMLPGLKSRPLDRDRLVMIMASIIIVGVQKDEEAAAKDSRVVPLFRDARMK
jgi:hypothetical protein